jgi:hypothetical protein
MDKYSIANNLLSEGYEETLEESQVVVDFLTNAALAMTMGTLLWNKFKGQDEPSVKKMITDKYKEIKNKKYEGKSPLEKVRAKLSSAIEDSEVYIHDIFHAVAHKKEKPETAATKLSKKLKLDAEEHSALLDYLTDVASKLSSIKPLIEHD